MQRTIGGILLAALAAFVACGGSEFKAATGDAGAADGSSADAATTSDATAPACVVPPGGSGNERDFCAFLAAQFSACGECEACRQLDANQCVQLGDVLSPALKSALVACKDSLGCGPLTDYANNPCVRMHLAQSPMSSAAQQAKTAYCNACPNNHNECQRFFDLSPDAGDAAGLGAAILMFDDAIDQQIATTCSGTSPKCDAFGYSVCWGLLFCGNGNAPHTNCSAGLCK